MRRRTAAVLLIVCAIGSVVTYQAMTHEPPTPLAHIDPITPRPPMSRYDCIDGRVWMTYTSGTTGERFEPFDTGRSC